MYRAVTLAAVRAGINLTNEAELAALLPTLQLEMPAGRVILNGEDISGLIRTARITQLSRAVADSPVVRRFLGQLQRQVAAGRDVVTEGRDQGTVVFPHAECKFFLTAQASERARRRHQELLSRGQEINFEAVLQAQLERDANDAARSIAPMVPAPDAILVDSTGLSPEAVLDVLEQHFRDRVTGRGS
jgi:cytidylate kinase